MCQEMLTRTSPDSVLPTHVGSQIPIPNTFYPETHTVSNVNILDVPLTNAYTIFYNEKRLLLSQENSSASFPSSPHTQLYQTRRSTRKSSSFGTNSLPTSGNPTSTPCPSRDSLPSTGLGARRRADWPIETSWLDTASAKSKRGLASSLFRTTSHTNSPKRRVARTFSTVWSTGRGFRKPTRVRARRRREIQTSVRWKWVADWVRSGTVWRPSRKRFDSWWNSIEAVQAGRGRR